MLSIAVDFSQRVKEWQRFLALAQKSVAKAISFYLHSIR